MCHPLFGSPNLPGHQVQLKRLSRHQDLFCHHKLLDAVGSSALLVWAMHTLGRDWSGSLFGEQIPWSAALVVMVHLLHENSASWAKLQCFMGFAFPPVSPLAGTGQSRLLLVPTCHRCPEMCWHCWPGH